MFSMAEINKLSPEQALKKLRQSDASKSKNAQLDEKNAELDEDIKRMREQRLRLERRQKKRDQVSNYSRPYRELAGATAFLPFIVMVT
jgi:hypothetical protein